MKLAFQKMSLTTRATAGAVLLSWLAALVFCAALCAQTEPAPCAAKTHCHAEAADSPHCHHHDSDSPVPSHHGPCSSASCQTLKDTLLSSKAAPAFHPVLLSLYTLPVFAVTLDGTDPDIHHNFRHTKTRDWGFTPEVCLGPALHSLAPPSLHTA
jgi:hypothetical protein